MDVRIVICKAKKTTQLNDAINLVNGVCIVTIRNLNLMDNQMIVLLRQKENTSKDIRFLSMEIHNVLTIQCKYIYT
jgi:hypothetical protein